MKLPRLINLFNWLVFVLSSIVIVLAARGDLWLDEIWSISFAKEAETVVDIFARFHHDNNHPLNTLFLYCLGDQQILMTYRLLSALAGIGSLFLASYVAKRDWGHKASLCCIILMGSSYPLLLYFSEARGYALAIFFGLVSYTVLGLPHKERNWKQIILFWSSSVLGILAHASFVMLSFAFALWSILKLVEAGKSYRHMIRQLIALHVLPLLFFAWWYAFFLENIEIGGGPTNSIWSVIGRASMFIFGLPEVSIFKDLTPFLGLLTVTLGSVILYHQHDRRWSFFPIVILISPTLFLLIAAPKHLYFRYFLVCFPFIILLLAYILSNWYNSSKVLWKWFAFIILLGVSLGQTPRNYHLLELGRGQYADALQLIIDQSPGGNILVGSDHDFRNQMLFDFYTTRVKGGSKLRYVAQVQWRKEPPDWILMHSQDIFYQPKNEFVKKGVGKYKLIDQYGFSGISGWSWFLYRATK